MDWLNGLIIPVIKVAFIGGILLFICYFVGKAFWKVWSRSMKFTFKYKILRRKYPDDTISWVVNCIEKGVGYYDAKKFLMVRMVEDKKIRETMWIFDQTINELNREHFKELKKEKKQKGGVENGRQFERSDSQIKTATGKSTDTNLPPI